jgi:starch-binding outer membrane protein, SusD/RagB family
MRSGRVFLFIFISNIFTYSCTKLNETLEGNLTPGQVSKDTSAAALLRGVYTSLEYTFTSFQEIFALSDFTTDEAIAPTRGPDWDDNGSWRVLHQHKWDANNSHIRDCFTSLGGVVYTATDMLQYKANVQEQAEARFLRAWAIYWLLDLFDQVPYREPGDSVVQPAKVRIGREALNYIISEVNAVEPDLPDGPASNANKYAAKVLLMKCYLNKGVYANRANPNFDPTDMNKVISFADEVINSGKYTFSANYFDNFAPDNGAIGSENIFTQLSSTNDKYVVFMAWLTVLHYNQGGGFNGFTTLSDFYSKFELNDKRREAVYDYPNSPPNPGRRVNLGFLIGQQYDLYTDVPLTDRPGAPLIFTTEVKNIETSTHIECTGIRPLKYAPDYLNFSQYSHPDNDFVYFRLPDVLLMKAEAILRGGTPTNAPYGSNALDIVNAIRTDPSRGATPLPSIDTDVLLDERGRELWWEGWRRQDLIRFGKFLQPFQEKDYQSDPKYLLFPIPNDQLAVNSPNLVQNPGY